MTPNTSIAASQFASGPVINVISWDVSQRPENSNLVFEQVLPNGIAVNAELPRPDPIVPSAGTGAVRLTDPGTNYAEVQVRGRLINLGDNSTIDQREIIIPISGRGSGGAALETTAEVTQSASTPVASCEFNWLVSTISGCPAEAPQQVTMTTQEFEHGIMLRAGANGTIYVLVDNGTAGIGQPTGGGTVGTVPSGLEPPAPTFEASWMEFRDALGFATGPEGTYSATVQRGVATGTQDVYLTLSDGRTVRLSGPTGQPNVWVAVG
jgi:hypothetical protein